MPHGLYTSLNQKNFSIAVILTAAILLFAGRPAPAQFLETIARTEMEAMIQAESIANIDTNFYYTLENLDDLAVSGLLREFNYINDGGGAAVIDPATARFLPQRVDVVNRFLNWQGPYLTYQDSQIDLDNVFGYDRGTPLDPWGEPYYLYTPVGFVRPPMSITQEFYGDAFDRYAIVSFGRDGRFQGNDDIIVRFGAPPTVLTLSSVSPLNLVVGQQMQINGYNMGQFGGPVEILLNNKPVSGGITTWTPTRIVKTIRDNDPKGEVTLQLRDPFRTTQPIAVEIREDRSAVSDWQLYR